MGNSSLIRGCALALCASGWLLGCSGGDDGGAASTGAPKPSVAAPVQGNTPLATTPSTPVTTPPVNTPSVNPGPTVPSPQTPVPTQPTTPPPSPMNPAGMAGSAAPVMMNPTTPLPAPGPDDGDPSKPVVAIPDVACKPEGGAVFGLGAPNFKMDDRDVIVSYPCNKHEGAPMTFILNLHGTTPVDLHFYQEGYFSASKYTGSRNLIVVTPSSVVEQWGNGDDGKDEPHLMKLIDWVYTTFGSKFDIRQMWVGGHSWGAMYTAQFGCKPELQDKVKGVIIMSGAPTMPACSSRISVIISVAEMDIGPAADQAAVPMGHGCGAQVKTMLGNNEQTLWPDCNPGFVHATYMMLGKMHTDSMDAVVVESIIDLINKARP